MEIPVAAPSGSTSVGTVPSGFKITKLVSPPTTGVQLVHGCVLMPPAGVVISTALTVMLAAGLVEVVRNAKKERAIPEWAGIVRSKVVSAGGRLVRVGGLVTCWNEAYTPAGTESARRKLRSRFVKFWTVTTNARSRPVLSGLEVCGEESNKPCVIRLA